MFNETQKNNINKQNPFLSIVMPVYRVEKVLEAAVEDVLNQTFSDFEIILVDDCSPDGSGALCDELAKKDSRITTIHLPQNGGASNARNQGIQISQGEYILFLDGDDKFDSDMLEKTVKVAKETSADAVMFGLLEEHYDAKGDLRNTVLVCPKRESLKNEKELRAYVIEMEKTNLYGYSTNKLYKSEIIKKNNVQFIIMKFNEDIIFNIDFFNHAQTLEVIDFAPYHYLKRVDSSTTSRFIPTYYDDIMLKIKRLYEQFESWDMLTDDILTVIAQRYVRYVFSALERNNDKRANMKGKQRKAFLQEIYKTDLYGKLSPYMTWGGVSGIMAKSLKNKRTTTCLAIAKLIKIIKKVSPGLFLKIS